MATVSRTMNSLETVDPALAARVRAAMKKLGYRPNYFARNLRRKRTSLWRLIISDIENPFFAAVARGVEDIAIGSGFSLVICNADEDIVAVLHEPPDHTLLGDARHRGVEGGILQPSKGFDHSSSRLSVPGTLSHASRALSPALSMARRILAGTRLLSRCGQRPAF